MINQKFKNGFMNCQVVSIHTTNMATKTNVAIVATLDKENNIKSYVVVNNLIIDNGNGSWGFAYQYDISNLTSATQVFLSKIQ